MEASLKINIKVQERTKQADHYTFSENRQEGGERAGQGSGTVMENANP